MPLASTRTLPSDESARAMVVPSAAAGADAEAAGADAAAEGAADGAAADGAVLAPLLEHAARMALKPMASAMSRCFCIPGSPPGSLGRPTPGTPVSGRPVFGGSRI